MHTFGTDLGRGVVKEERSWDGSEGGGEGLEGGLVEGREWDRNG